MTITNGYCTLAELKAELGISSTDVINDAQMGTAINAASRQIDGYTGRRFWVDGSVATRQYYADTVSDCAVDDISTTTGLVVKIDDTDTGAFSTTLTVTTTFILLPTNAADRVPVWPYTDLRIVDGSAFPMSNSGRPGVQVTAKFGWPAVPDDVRKAALIQSAQLFKAKDAAFGVASFGDSGVMSIRGTLNQFAAALLEPYCKPRIS